MELEEAIRCLHPEDTRGRDDIEAARLFRVVELTPPDRKEPIWYTVVYTPPSRRVHAWRCMALHGVASLGCSSVRLRHSVTLPSVHGFRDMLRPSLTAAA